MKKLLLLLSMLAGISIVAVDAMAPRRSARTKKVRFLSLNETQMKRHASDGVGYVIVPARVKAPVVLVLQVPVAQASISTSSAPVVDQQDQEDGGDEFEAVEVKDEQPKKLDTEGLNINVNTLSISPEKPEDADSQEEKKHDATVEKIEKLPVMRVITPVKETVRAPIEMTSEEIVEQQDKELSPLFDEIAELILSGGLFKTVDAVYIEMVKNKIAQLFERIEDPTTLVQFRLGVVLGFFKDMSYRLSSSRRACFGDLKKIVDLVVSRLEQYAQRKPVKKLFGLITTQVIDEDQPVAPVLVAYRNSQDPNK